MLPQMFASTNIPVLAEVLNFTQSRHTVLAGNVTNVNTPGYRLRDLSQTAFQEQLKEAIAQSKRRAEPGFERQRAGNASPGLVSSRAGDELREVSRSLENLLYHDDTNIDLEKQVTEMSKNHLLHNFALTVMTDQFALLQAAISERI
jgi:flagellar basal-body rod protein FlgB